MTEIETVSVGYGLIRPPCVYRSFLYLLYGLGLLEPRKPWDAVLLV